MSRVSQSRSSRALVHRLVALAAPLVAGLTLGVVPARAQTTDPLSPLDPTNRFAVEVVLDSARLLGLPTRPLVNRALLGIAKHADNRKITASVRQLFAMMKVARTALGPSIDETELDAAASVLQAGVPASVLARFRPARSGGVAKPLAVPLVVLADLITRGVPIDTASTAIVQLWQRGAGESDFYGLWRGVEQDILSGQNPGTALQQRVRDLPVRTPPGAIPQPESPESEK